MARSIPTPHDDIEVQDQLNYVRNLRTLHSDLSLLMAKKFHALDFLEQLWHEAGLIRARPCHEQFDSPAWKKYSAAVKVVKGINQEEETLWQALLALRRANDSPQVVTSTTKPAYDRAQEATASQNTATYDINGAQPSGTSPDHSQSKHGDLTVQGAAQVPTGPQKCSDTNATDRSASREPPLNSVQVKDHWLAMNQVATANIDTQPELCTIPPVALEPSTLMQGVVSRLCTAYKILSQGTSVIRMLRLWCASFGLLAFNQIINVDWFSPVKVVTRLDVVVFVAMSLIGHAYLRR